MPVDFAALWDFSRPDVSESRFIGALDGASPDERLLLRTQIARTHGLRRDFARALQVLDEMAPELPQASAEVQVRHALERGRARVSATHRPGSVTAEDRAAAGADYQRAAALAQAAGLDGLAVDALHMMAVVDTAPADQERWYREALAVAHASSRPEAARWEAPLQHGLGLALHAQDRLDTALVAFQAALDVRARGPQAGATRVATWMVAWTLRGLQRLEEALALQERLRDENDAAGQPDLHVFEELGHLYEALGRPEDAEAARERLVALRP